MRPIILTSNWKPIFIWGLMLTLLGFVAVYFATITTIISVILLGGLILMGGSIILIDAFTLWRSSRKIFFIQLVIGILYVLIGLFFIEGPILSSLSLTVVLATFYICIGTMRIIYSLVLQTPKWKWNLLYGVLGLLFGILIFLEWPTSGLYLIGLFIGIDLILCGTLYILIALTMRNTTLHSK